MVFGLKLLWYQYLFFGVLLNRLFIDIWLCLIRQKLVIRMLNSGLIKVFSMLRVQWISFGELNRFYGVRSIEFIVVIILLVWKLIFCGVQLEKLKVGEIKLVMILMLIVVVIMVSRLMVIVRLFLMWLMVLIGLVIILLNSDWVLEIIIMVIIENSRKLNGSFQWLLWWILFMFLLQWEKLLKLSSGLEK